MLWVFGFLEVRLFRLLSRYLLQKLLLYMTLFSLYNAGPGSGSYYNRHGWISSVLSYGSKDV